MKMLACDLDNTFIFRKVNPLCDYIPVEYNHGKPVMYISKKALELFRTTDKCIEFVPVTARSIEEFKRINIFAQKQPQYVITSLGGVILKNGNIDAEWEKRREAIMRSVRKILKEIFLKYKTKEYILRAMVVDESYLFIQSKCAENTASEIQSVYDESCLDILSRKEKIYIVPKEINKESAVRRVRTELDADVLVVAGDSDADNGMLNIADYALVPGQDMIERLKPRYGAFTTHENDFASFIFNFTSKL